MGEKIVGFHAIEEGLKKAGRSSVLYLERGAGSRVQRIEHLGQANGKVVIKKVPKAELDRIAQRSDHRGAVLDLAFSASAAVVEKGNRRSVKEFIESLDEDESALVLVLDEVTDVQNLGAILRSADQFAVSLVILPERRSAQINPTVVKISSGAAHWVPVSRVVNLNRELEILKQAGFWVYGAALGGDSLHQTTFSKRTVLVMGSEGKGISPMTEKLCDHLVTIPTGGHIDSLNVSVATGIMLYEYRRQQF
ncbi:MAG: 23S rRNA (guanosine(2251)-2'-O)-methyltransferase RlmB [Sphaerochaeta sp.]|jgi:23S rRNA (guanosine2251-2'-O)-methyltransferase|nr:23S rRNA (guanosine(2251)-2'-O)-methyltransferase RlmB [Spirochaetales bacterium]